MDWSSFERAAALAAGTSGRMDGASLADLRERIGAEMGPALAQVASEGELVVDPGTELLVVDRPSWAVGNVRSLREMLPDLPVTGAQGAIVAIEGGAILGLAARAVVAQYDPFRDALIVCYPNLGELGAGDGLRWLMYHELTHLGQFRTAPWIAGYLSEQAKQAMSIADPEYLAQMAGRLVTSLPEIALWLRRVFMGGEGGDSPLLNLLPDEQRQVVARLHAMLTVLEGHATLLTDRIADRTIPGHREMQERLKTARKRPPWLRVLEALAGLDMKRQQYVRGRRFCEVVWERGGASALRPFFEGPDNIPLPAEIEAPEAWLERVG